MEMCSDAEVEEAEESSYILMDYTPLDTPSSAGSWGQCPALRHAPDTEPALVSSSLRDTTATSSAVQPAPCNTEVTIKYCQ